MFNAIGKNREYNCIKVKTFRTGRTSKKGSKKVKYFKRDRKKEEEIVQVLEELEQDKTSRDQHKSAPRSSFLKRRNAQTLFIH